MKSLILAFAATALIAGLTGSVSAHEISKLTLGSMGLGSMQQLSDHDGLAVRGKGAYAYGISTAVGGGSSSVNGYAVGSTNSPAKAFGANISATGAVINNHLFIFNIAAGVSSAHTP